MHKIVLILLALFICNVSSADSEEIVVTSVSYHPMISKQTSDKLSNGIAQGLNYTPMYGYVRTSNDMLFYSSYKAFVGLNCIAEPMAGGILSAGADIINLQVGLVGGAYYQDSKKFSERGINTYFGDVTPIMGFEVNYRVYLDERAFVKVTNTITHMLTNHALSFGLDL